jgi:tetratricopeptide (TPR) repeat protein
MRILLAALVCLSLFSPAQAAVGEKDGWVLFRQRDYSAALQRFEVDVNKYREWAVLRDAMGWCLYYMGEYDEAETRFREALKLQPDYKWSLEGLEALAAVRRAPLDEANSLLATGRYREARSAFLRIQAGKTSADTHARGLALRGEAWCFYYLGLYSDAVKAFREARNKLGKDPECLRGMGYCQFAQADYRHALTSLKLSLEAEPENTTARLTAGWCQYWLKKYDRAQDEFNRALFNAPATWAAHAGLAWCALKTNDYPAARRAFEEGLDISPYIAGTELEALIEARPTWRELRNAIGWSALRADLSSWALWEFQTSQAQGCQEEEAAAGQAFALFRMSRYDEALTQARSVEGSAQHTQPHKFLTALPEGGTAEVAMNLASLEGWIAQRQGRYDDALDRFREVRRAHFDWPDPACGEGWALYAQGNYPAAEEAFEDALKLLPGYADANSGREAIRTWRFASYDAAWAAYYAGEFGGARRGFESILSDSHDPFPRTQLDLVQAALGWTEFRMGNTRIAEDWFKLALLDQPNQGLAHKGRGFIALAEKNFKAAAGHFEAALATREFAEDAETWIELGRAGLFSNRFPAAIKALNKAVELGAELARAHAWQGLALQATGDSVAARIAIERAISLDPSTAAEPEIRKLIDNNPEFFRLHSPLGWAWFYRGYYTLAAEEFANSIKKDALETSAFRGRGLSLLRTGQTKAGAKELGRWLDAAPNHEATWGIWSSTFSELAWSLYAAEEYSDALKLFKQLDDLHDGEDLQYADPHDGQGWCYLRMRKPREAKKAFLKAIAESPRHESSLKGLEALAEAR